jgi:hypothetical protein
MLELTNQVHGLDFQNRRQSRGSLCIRRI